MALITWAEINKKPRRERIAYLLNLSIGLVALFPTWPLCVMLGCLRGCCGTKRIEIREDTMRLMAQYCDQIVRIHGHMDRLKPNV